MQERRWHIACLAKSDSPVLLILWATDWSESVPCILQVCDAPAPQDLTRTPGLCTCLHGTKACRQLRTVCSHAMGLKAMRCQAPHKHARRMSLKAHVCATLLVR